MTNRSIFIIIPSLAPTGPVKGAVALCNALADLRHVTLVALKPGSGGDIPLDRRVAMVSMGDIAHWPAKVSAYRHLLRNAGGRARVASISFCLSADMLNLLCRREALTCSSVRGNLPQIYRLTYGRLGFVAAFLHLFLLRGFDRIVAMSSSMAEQTARYSGRQPAIIGNFIEEEALEGYRPSSGPKTGPYRFVFLASLTHRKKPDLLLRAAAELASQKIDFSIDLVGDGLLRENLESLAERLGISGYIHFHGYQAEPFPLLVHADCLVLPSLAEGLPRAMLEALYLGVPCVVRDVDGLKEVIVAGRNGFLFRDDSELASIMVEAAQWSRKSLVGGENLLPPEYRQQGCARRYLELVET